MSTSKNTKAGVLLSTSYAGTMLVSMFLGYRLGVWLDARFHSDPIFLIVGLLLGIFLGLYTVVREILYFGQINRKDR